MRYGPLAAAVLLIGIGAVVHGYLTQRWTGGSSEEMQRLVARYKLLPATIGDWTSTDNKVSKGEMRSAGAYAYLSRTYHNSRTNENVGVFLICGYARDVAVHTPDACYVGQGFAMTQEPKTMKIPAGTKAVNMYMSTFQKQLVHQQIFWAWNVGDGWQAPNYPRAKYPPRVPLNKIYLISDVNNETQSKPEKSPSANFADTILPVISKVLYPTGTQVTEEASADAS